MSTATILKLDDKQYVILPREEYDRLNGLAKSVQLPPLPPPDADGNYPAVEYARVSIARDIIRERVSLGLTQRELARLAGVRVETLCRIETGRHTPSIRSVDKLDLALKQAARMRQHNGKGTQASAR